MTSILHVSTLQLLGWAGLGLVILLKQNYLGTSISSEEASYSRLGHQDLDHYPHQPGAAVYRAFPSHTRQNMDGVMVTWSRVFTSSSSSKPT